MLDTHVQECTLYEYRLADVVVNGMVEYSHSIQVAVGEVTDVETQLSATLSQFELQPTFPNPFNPTTTIRYNLPKSGEVSLKAVNLSGREVATLAEGQRSPGQFQLTWNITAIPSATYLVVLRSGGEMHVQ